MVRCRLSEMGRHGPPLGPTCRRTLRGAQLLRRGMAVHHRRADAEREEPHLMPPARDPSNPSTTRKVAASTRAKATTAKKPVAAPKTAPAEPAVVRLEIYATQAPPTTRKPAARKPAVRKKAAPAKPKTTAVAAEVAAREAGIAAREAAVTTAETELATRTET